MKTPITKNAEGEKTMIKWEYKTEYINEYSLTEKQEKTLNDLGKEGWEMISLIKSSGGPTNRSYFQAFFKRPIDQPSAITQEPTHVQA